MQKFGLSDHSGFRFHSVAWKGAGKQHIPLKCFKTETD